MATPITEKHSDALVYDYEAEHKLVYLKDINFDAAGRPVVLFLTSGGYAPGPKNDPRQWFTANWTGDSWTAPARSQRAITTTTSARCISKMDCGGSLQRQNRARNRRRWRRDRDVDEVETRAVPGSNSSSSRMTAS